MFLWAFIQELCLKEAPKTGCYNVKRKMLIDGTFVSFYKDQFDCCQAAAYK